MSICSLCGKNESDGSTAIIREKNVLVCEKCNSKIERKFKGRNFQTKKARTAHLDSLDTIHNVGSSGHMKIRVDSREILQWNFGNYSNIGVYHNGMNTGDYQLIGLESEVVVDRKSLSDFIGTIVQGKDRFERELGRMQGYKHRYIFIEATIEEIMDGEYRSRTPSSSIFGIFLSLEMRYNVKFLFLNDRKTCVRRLVALYDQVIRKEQRLLETQENHARLEMVKDSFEVKTLTVETFITGLKEKPEKLKAVIDSMEGIEHKYLIVRKSWADIVKSESELGISVISLMQSVSRLEIEYDIRIKFISRDSITKKYIDKVKEFAEKNKERTGKILKGFEKELEKKDQAFVV